MLNEILCGSYIANYKNSNKIGGVMVSVLTWGVVDRGSIQKMIKIGFFLLLRQARSTKEKEQRLARN